VLVSRVPARYVGGMNPIRRILVATDFSDLASAALEQALDLAKQLGATITLVHSYEIPIYGFPDGVLVAPADVATRIASTAQTELEALVQRHGGRGVEMTAVLRMGPPWEEINTLAEETKADMIVIGTHGRRGLSRALLGSVAERVMRTAVKPLLVVHAAKS
jgi:nucleotide-binding universal stress UspA family protein